MWAVVAESIFIDIEHWRHYFLILGVLWGLMAASRASTRSCASRAHPRFHPPQCAGKRDPKSGSEKRTEEREGAEGELA